ncbi:MAG: O-antigen ligase family protein [Planctomycetota bacterium]
MIAPATKASLRALIEIGLLALAVPLFFLAHAFDVLEAKRAVLLLLGGLLVARLALGGSLLARARLPGPVLLVAIVALLGALGWVALEPRSANAWLGLKQELLLLVLVAVAVAVQQTSFGRERPFVGLLLAPAVLVALYAMAQAAGREPFYPITGATTPVATFGNGNALGEYLAPVAVLFLVLFGTATGWRALGLGAGAALLCAAVIETQSRGALLAVLGGVAIALLARPRPGQGGVVAGRTAAAILLGACLGVLASGAHVLAFKPLPNVSASIFSARYPTNAYRLALYRGSLAVARQSPWIGCGAGSFRTVFASAIVPAQRHPGSWAAELELLQPGTLIDEPHQDLSWIAVECGMPAAALYVVAGLLTLLATLRCGASGDARAAIRIAAGAGACAFFLNGAVRTCLLNPGAALAAFMMLGLLFAPAAEVFEAPRSWLRSTMLIVLLGLPAIVVGVLTLGSQFCFARVGKIAAADTEVEIERVDALLTRAERLDPSDYYVRSTHLQQVLMPWIGAGAPPGLREQAHALAQWLLSVQPSSRAIAALAHELSPRASVAAPHRWPRRGGARGAVDRARQDRRSQAPARSAAAERGGQRRCAAGDVSRAHARGRRGRGRQVHAQGAARIRLRVHHARQARRRGARSAPRTQLRRGCRRAMDARGAERDAQPSAGSGPGRARRCPGARPRRCPGLGARRDRATAARSEAALVLRSLALRRFDAQPRHLGGSRGRILPPCRRMPAVGTGSASRAGTAGVQRTGAAGWISIASPRRARKRCARRSRWRFAITTSSSTWSTWPSRCSTRPRVFCRACCSGSR